MSGREARRNGRLPDLSPNAFALQRALRSSHGPPGCKSRGPSCAKIRSRTLGRSRLVPDCGPVLIVDDDGGFRALVAVLLHRAGFRATVEARTGEEALAVVRVERPALVLLDVFLPDINGFEICRTLRDEFGDDLPIIFVSGERIEPADRAVGLLVGGDDYLVKPIDSDEFLARVRRAIARSQRGSASSSTPSRSLDLTKRELEVLGQLAHGHAQSEIAADLVISPKTVASHIQRILAKLDVHSRAQAVAVAYESGLIRGPTSAPEVAAAVETPAPADGSRRSGL